VRQADWIPTARIWCGASGRSRPTERGLQARRPSIGVGMARRHQARKGHERRRGCRGRRVVALPGVILSEVITAREPNERFAFCSPSSSCRAPILVQGQRRISANPTRCARRPSRAAGLVRRHHACKCHGRRVVTLPGVILSEAITARESSERFAFCSSSSSGLVQGRRRVSANPTRCASGSTIERGRNGSAASSTQGARATPMVSRATPMVSRATSGHASGRHPRRGDHRSRAQQTDSPSDRPRRRVGRRFWWR